MSALLAAPYIYQRHSSESSILYKVIENNFESYLETSTRLGAAIPSFVKKEFYEYLKCGCLEHGFIRVQCRDCHLERVLPFSCKLRGFCPSCCAKRMIDTAWFQTENVFPHVDVRQWVLSFPYRVRFLMAHNPKLTSKILTIFIRTVSSWLKKAAKRDGIKNAKTGAVTFIQRFGSAVNLNQHYHSLFLDGVFYEAKGEWKFHQTSAPTQTEQDELVIKLQIKIDVLIKKIFGDENQNELEFTNQAMNKIKIAAIQHKTRNGEKLKRYGYRIINEPIDHSSTAGSNIWGYSLHSRTHIKAHQRGKLEKLIRYTARGPIALERLEELYDGRLVYKMKSRWKDGTEAIGFTPFELIERLIALVPPPRANLVRYFGVLAANFKSRKAIVPRPGARGQPLDPHVKTDGAVDLSQTEKQKAAQKQPRRDRLTWAEALKRAFNIDVLHCERCGGQLKLIAVIKDPKVIDKILIHLKLKNSNTTGYRGPPWPAQEVFYDQDNQIPSDW